MRSNRSLKNIIRTRLFLVRFVGAVQVCFAFLFLFVMAVDKFLRGLACVTARVGTVRVLFGLLLGPTLATVSTAGRIFIGIIVVLVIFIIHVLLLPLRGHSASPTDSIKVT